MEPQIQYAKTSDGVSIAYWTIGDGPPLVMTPGSAIGPALRSWESEEGRRFFELLAQHRKMIRYDNRGCGNSQRDTNEASLDAWVADLAAVVDHLALDRFPLLALGFSVPIAIAYASRYPDRVSKLIIWTGSARGIDHWNRARLETARKAAEEDPDFFLEIVAHEVFGWSMGEHAQGWVAALKDEGVHPLMVETISYQLELDVTHLLPAVTAPTLVLHRRQVPFPPLSAGRLLAAEIPNARLVVLEGDSAAIYTGDTEPVLRAIGEFLGEPEPIAHGAATVRLPFDSVPTFAGGRYTVIRLLGEGGQKTVYLVHDAALERDCALALLKTEVLDADSLARVRREGQAMARLAHPNIVTSGRKTGGRTSSASTSPAATYARSWTGPEARCR